jgi:predicted porin
MAESLLAVAVAAALPVVAHAQVSLSGRIDTAVATSKTKLGVSSTGLASNTLTTNQLVLQGSEDLTGGMKANFIINSQFASDQKAALDWGHRGITVGLSGGFGAVDLGRSTCTTLCSITASGLIGNLGNMTATAQTIRPDNSITYTTPSMSGLRLKVVHGLEESKTTEKSVTEFAALYAAGPLDVLVAYVDEKGSASQYVEAGYAPVAASPAVGTAPSVIFPSKNTGLRVNYNAGFATLHVRWHDLDLTIPSSSVTSTTPVDTTEYGLGASIPLGGDRTVFVDYRVFNPSVANTDWTRISAALVQTLSKRTNVYAALWNDKKDDAADKNEGTFFAVGVRHNF